MKHDMQQCFSNNEARTPMGCDVMLKGVRMTQENRYTYTIFMNNGHIYS